ncbi:MAG: redoxin domain-containing protein [Candidatus Magasanikbacteria bacterium]|nr:redoxin domain-containing protein [Candidatus Magasanikbacteria bacterium]
MKKENNNNIIWTIGITALIMLAIFGLVKGVYQKTTEKQESKATATASDDMAGHHGGSSQSTPPASALGDLMGKPMPDFSLTDINGKEYTMKDLSGKKVVMFFNEGLMCYPACWNQIAALAKDERLKNDDTVVLSVVVDPAKDWQRAIDKMPELGLALVGFDKNAALAGKLGLLTMPSSMHYGSLPGHTYLIIDKQGIIKHVFDDPNMALHNEQLVAELVKL